MRSKNEHRLQKVEGVGMSVTPEHQTALDKIKELEARLN